MCLYHYLILKNHTDVVLYFFDDKEMEMIYVAISVRLCINVGKKCAVYFRYDMMLRHLYGRSTIWLKLS